MPNTSALFTLNRRKFLVGMSGALGLAMLPPWAKAVAASQDRLKTLKTGAATFSLEPDGPEAVSGAWGYNEQIPGPLLRFRQGDRLKVVLRNGLDQDTTIHWHGIRLPNAMDGVPYVTQPPVEPGDEFEYAFDLPDAGTYWYHPHLNATEQLGRGLSGPLVIDEPEPYPADRDLLWFLDDWLLDQDARIVESFNEIRDITHEGRIGNTITVNGRLPHAIKVRPGERLRVRLINGANGRIFSLTFGDLPVHVIALDGQPVEPHEPDQGRVLLGPAMRADLIIDCTGDDGRTVAVEDSFQAGREFELMTLEFSGPAVDRDDRQTPPPALPANPVPEPVLDDAEQHEVVFGGGMRGDLDRQKMMEMRRHGLAWTVNGEPVHDNGKHEHDPLFILERDRSYRIVFRNETEFHHPIHLHGHHFRVIARNGEKLAIKPLRDTMLMDPRETVEIAFVADNPGDWMLHCHILEHQVGGMNGMFRVRG